MVPVALQKNQGVSQKAGNTMRKSMISTMCVFLAHTLLEMHLTWAAGVRITNAEKFERYSIPANTPHCQKLVPKPQVIKTKLRTYCICKHRGSYNTWFTSSSICLVTCHSSNESSSHQWGTMGHMEGYWTPQNGIMKDTQLRTHVVVIEAHSTSLGLQWSLNHKVPVMWI